MSTQATAFPKRTFDVLIVGSGVAGGRVAERLTAAGQECLVIEAGRHFETADFPRPLLQEGELFWRQGLDFTSDGSLFVMRGKCVGGGSVVNQALLDRFTDRVWDEWRRATGVQWFDAAHMDPEYDRLLNDGGFAHRTIGASDRNRNGRLFAEGMARRGWRTKCLHRAQADCGWHEGQNCLDCLAGCPRGAKQSALVTTLRRAREQGLAILPRTTVERIDASGPAIELSVCRDGQRERLKGRRLVLAAGAVGTTELLLRSGFKRPLPALGEGFYVHPQYYTWAAFDDDVDADMGAFQSCASDEPRFTEQGFKLENVAMPPHAMSLLMPIGATDDPRLRDYRRWACAEVSICDAAPGRLVRSLTGGVSLEKPLTEGDRKRRQAGQKVLSDVFRAVGARRVVHSWMGLSVHPMGGCGIGTDGERHVVDPEFRLHGHSGIYVADSSLFPRPPGLNPSLTVMALAERAARSMLSAGNA